MFIQNLNEKQQQAFMALAEKVAFYADGVNAAKEEARLQAFREQLPGISAEPCGYEELTSLFDTKLARSSALLELIGLAAADEHIAEEEQVILDAIAKAFSISKDEMINMTSWVKRMIVMFQEVQTYMEE
jgi:hemerythrin-like domain-containing protein